MPLTFGSSLRATTVPLGRRDVDWFVTTVPFARAEASVMSNWITSSSSAGRFRLRMSRTPVPLVPPVALVLLVLAPGGTVTSVSEPGTYAGSGLRAPRSSKTRKLGIAWSVVRKRSV